MAAIMCSGPCAHPFKDFNDLFGKGVPAEIAKALTVPSDFKKVNMVETGIDTAHYEKDWLGTDAWFGPERGQKLFKTFVFALQIADGRPVHGVWKPGLAVRASVVDNGDAIQVVVTSPRPKNGDAHAAGPCGHIHPV